MLQILAAFASYADVPEAHLKDRSAVPSFENSASAERQQRQAAIDHYPGAVAMNVSTMRLLYSGGVCTGSPIATNIATNIKHRTSVPNAAMRAALFGSDTRMLHQTGRPATF